MMKLLPSTAYLLPFAVHSPTNPPTAECPAAAIGSQIDKLTRVGWDGSCTAALDLPTGTGVQLPSQRVSRLANTAFLF
ncbi:MAG TPA: hypothetical protein VIH42_03070 [Thermoguttaceae bacterium]